MLNMYMFHRYTYAYVQRTGLSCCGSILWYSKFQRMYKSCGALAGATVVAAHALLSDDPTSSLPSFPLMFPTNMTTTPQKQNSGCRHHLVPLPTIPFVLSGTRPAVVLYTHMYVMQHTYDSVGIKRILKRGTRQ